MIIVEVHHVGRGCNRVADKMTVIGRGLLLMAIRFLEAPNGVREIAVEEMNGAMNGSGESVKEEDIPFDPGGLMAFLWIPPPFDEDSVSPTSAVIFP
ncbi:hypothetical protein V6N11_062868 [Hibiscus sabdariffa]|uniref:RNase H type-1 domain-containing protein n=1 Tax=Hibiscus sabdariffa TaxID=183260 RepID=A0ABR2NPH7_9ROSI